MLYISDMSVYTNIVNIGMYLVYLVLAYKERLISTVCFDISDMFGNWGSSHIYKLLVLSF